jgi:carbon monoxide dehydrogenase subunit G
VKMSGEQTLAVPRREVWLALNDPEVLKRCLPGCQSLERQSEECMTATLAIKVGPIGARFTGILKLSDVDPPNAYTLTMEGQGGTAGMVNGSARVQLEDRGNATVLTYQVDAKVGGRLAQLGGPIIDATAKQLASTFFQRFGESVIDHAPELQAQPSWGEHR